MADTVGIIRDAKICKMTKEQFDAVIVVHPEGGLETVPGWRQRSCGTTLGIIVNMSLVSGMVG